MSRTCLKLAVVLLLALTSCQTYVSRKVIDSEKFTFLHAGEEITLPVELQEIRTSTRRGRFLSGQGRNVSYSYAMVVSYNGKELIISPCQENSDIDDFVEKLQVKRSADRSHFAVGFDQQTVGIFHCFKNQKFIGYAPAINLDETIDFSTLNPDALPKVRSILMDHISGDNILQSLDEKTLVDMLCSVSPQDELNQEAIYMLIDNRLHADHNSESRLIDHGKKSDIWRKTALNLLKEHKEDQGIEPYLSKMYKLAGKQAVDEEDWQELRNYQKTLSLDYFSVRMKMNSPAMGIPVRLRLKQMLQKTVFNVCAISENQRYEILGSLQMLQDLGEARVFERFIESYEKSSCKSETIHEINNAFMFISNLKPTEKRAWVDFMIRNFKHVPPNDRDWDYDRIKEDLSCNEKRTLLLKYKKDIDTFGDMEIPDCN